MRDLFVKKGLVSEKHAREVDRALKQERKAAQGQRRSKEELEAEARKAAEAEALAALEARRQAAQAHAAEREAHEHLHRVRQIVAGNRLGGRGPIPFSVRLPGSARIRTLWLPEPIARDLRAGRAGVAGLPEGADWGVVVVSARAAEKLAQLAPEALLHHVTASDHLADPAEGLMVRAWESGLGPHRVVDPAELARFRLAA